MSRGLVSTVITTYYRNELLKRALESVRRAEYEPVEILVVDDSGEEHAKRIADAPDVEYISTDDIGPNRARTVGIEASSGEYVQLLDDDDQVTEDKFEKQVDRFEANPDVGVVYCGGIYTNGKTFSPKPDGRGDVLEDVLALELTGCITSAMLLRRSTVEQCLPFPDTPGFDDPFFKVEMAKISEFDFVDETLVIMDASDDSRLYREGEIVGMMRFFDEYSDFYDEFPDTVRQKAFSTMYRKRGYFRLTQRPWSAQATKDFAKAARLVPKSNWKSMNFLWYVGLSVSSLLGRPGVTAFDAAGRRTVSLVSNVR